MANESSASMAAAPHQRIGSIVSRRKQREAAIAYGGKYQRKL